MGDLSKITCELFLLSLLQILAVFWHQFTCIIYTGELGGKGGKKMSACSYYEFTVEELMDIDAGSYITPHSPIIGPIPSPSC